MRQVPVLMYHSISNVVTPAFAAFTVTPARFAEHLAALAEGGWSLATFSEAAAALRDPPAVEAAKMVAVTIDDGLRDFHSEALPILAAARASATIFVPTAHIGGSARWMCGVDGQRPLLGWAQLQEAVTAGIEVASHGHLHMPLDTGHEADLYQDLLRSRSMLEDRLGLRVSALAYPFGYQTPKTRRVAARAGYEAACVITDMAAVPSDPMLAVPRITATQEMTGADLLDVIGRRLIPRQRSWRRGKQHLWITARRLGVVGPATWQGSD